MNDEPNFEALAELWLARDPRSQNLTPEAKAKIVSRLASALRKKRESTDHPAQDAKAAARLLIGGAS